MTSSPSLTPRPAGTRSAPGHAPAGTGTAWPRRLLACGVAAGPLWVVSVAVQALTRPGFSLTRSPASELDLGSLGWVQVATFIVTGLLIIAAAAGMRRGVPDGPGSQWIPRLLAVIGAGTIGGGLFHPDPTGGYPPGTPTGASAVVSWHGVLHAVCGTTAFIATVAVCLVFARRLAARGRRGLAACSRVAAVLVAAGAATASTPHGSLNLYAGVSIAFLWIAAAITTILTAARPTLPAVSDASALAGR